MKHRYETFGGIIASDNPPFLAFVDRQFMRELNLPDSPLWKNTSEEIGLLSAPTEIHLAATNACNGNCPHCYMNSSQNIHKELDTKRFKEALKLLAKWGVFHVALGGGDALLREDIFELAHYAREVGLVPNLTISGAYLTEQKARQMQVFGQVNISLDGVGEKHGVFRGKGKFRVAENGLRLLIENNVPTGINCVLGRRNFDGLEALFAYAAKIGANEIEFLRFKPVGRAVAGYERERTTYLQNLELIPLLLGLSERHQVRAKIDCSFVPMMCYHRPPQELLETTATYGCEAANVLLGIRADGNVGGCSFLPDCGVDLFELPDVWADYPNFQALRNWPSQAQEPCKSCDYLDLCKGGCHAVAQAVTGSLSDPDPDCPWVDEHRRSK